MDDDIHILAMATAAIDRHGAGRFVEAMADVCAARASETIDHCGSAARARQWKNAASALYRAAGKVEV